jgi:hypothetical protein
MFGNTDEKSGFFVFWQAVLEFFPGDFKLAYGPLMLKSVEPDVLD